MPSDGAGPESRRSRLAAEAPAEAKGVWARFGDRVYLCGTLSAAFDAWQRRLAALSGADAFFSQQIGLDLVEREMDRLEEEARTSLDDGETLLPRKSPGYGDMPLSLSREIVAKLDATKRIGVAVTASDLLVPSKSVTAVCEIRRPRGAEI